MPRVLVVEDDETVAGVLASYLQRDGHDATCVYDGRTALDAIHGDVPDLIVLDLMLPEVDGLEVCRQVRLSFPDLPVIMLTALAEAEDRIAGLEVGADDYVTKPFSPRELVLRIEALLRRSIRVTAVRQPEQIGRLTIDRAARQITRDGLPLALTVREFDLLQFLIDNPGVAFTREQLMRNVWGWTFGDQSTVTVHVRRLREKVEDDPALPRLICTVWGVGYRLETP